MKAVLAALLSVGLCRAGAHAEKISGGEAPAQPPQTGCSERQLSAISAARKTAFERSKRAIDLMMQRDTSQTDPADGPTSAQRAVQGYAQNIFKMEVSAEDVREDVIRRLVRMAQFQKEAPVICADAESRECGRHRWRAFVNANVPPIYFCPIFFRVSGDNALPLAEMQVRTVMHESAHLTGIGAPGPEGYCTIWDCDSPCHGQNSADAWAQLLHCVSGEAPDSPFTVRPGP